MGRLTKAIDSMAQSISAMSANLKEHDDHVEGRIRDIQNTERRKAKQAADK